MDEWFETDELQWVKQINASTFEVIDVEVVEYNGEVENFGLKHITVDVEMYYDSVEEMKKEYAEDWKQIMAEIVAEIDSIDRYLSLEKLQLYVKKETGFDVTEEEEE